MNEPKYMSKYQFNKDKLLIRKVVPLQILTRKIYSITVDVEVSQNVKTLSHTHKHLRVKKKLIRWCKGL